MTDTPQSPQPIACPECGAVSNQYGLPLVVAPAAVFCNGGNPACRSEQQTCLCHAKPSDKPVSEPVASRESLFRAALEKIRNLEPVPFPWPPEGWKEEREACAECKLKRWEGHPIQGGICDRHRKPFYARERHEEDEVRAIGVRAKDIAREAIWAANAIDPVPTEPKPTAPEPTREQILGPAFSGSHGARIWWDPIPGSHYSVSQRMIAQGIERPLARDEFDQGFWTDHDRFVDRAEGYAIAARAGQIVSHDPAEWNRRRLFSEDLWDVKLYESGAPAQPSAPAPDLTASELAVVMGAPHRTIAPRWCGDDGGDAPASEQATAPPQWAKPSGVSMSITVPSTPPVNEQTREYPDALRAIEAARDFEARETGRDPLNIELDLLRAEVVAMDATLRKSQTVETREQRAHPFNDEDAFYSWVKDTWGDHVPRNIGFIKSAWFAAIERFVPPPPPHPDDPNATGRETRQQERGLAGANVACLEEECLGFACHCTVQSLQQYRATIRQHEDTIARMRATLNSLATDDEVARRLDRAQGMLSTADSDRDEARAERDAAVQKVAELEATIQKQATDLMRVGLDLAKERDRVNIDLAAADRKNGEMVRRIDDLVVEVAMEIGLREVAENRLADLLWAENELRALWNTVRAASLNEEDLVTVGAHPETVDLARRVFAIEQCAKQSEENNAALRRELDAARNFASHCQQTTERLAAAEERIAELTRAIIGTSPVLGMVDPIEYLTEERRLSKSETELIGEERDKCRERRDKANARLRAAEERIGKLVKYATHADRCREYLRGSAADTACNCGLAALIAEESGAVDA